MEKTIALDPAHEPPRFWAAQIRAPRGAPARGSAAALSLFPQHHRCLPLRPARQDEGSCSFCPFWPDEAPRGGTRQRLPLQLPGGLGHVAHTHEGVSARGAGRTVMERNKRMDLTKDW